MKTKSRNLIFILFTIILINLSFLNVNAEESEGKFFYYGPSITYGEHTSNSYKLDDEYVFCVQRGVHIDDWIDETQEAYIDSGTKLDTVTTYEYFKGWGTWKMNSDATNATQDSTDGAPSDEEKAYGAVDIFQTKMIEAPNAISDGQYKALAIINEFFPTSNESSDIAIEVIDTDSEFRLKGALTWAVEKGFITYSGTANRVALSFNTSTGIVENVSWTGTCDEFMKAYLHNDATLMSYYREFVWKITNYHKVPSFSYPNWIDAYRNPIHLVWDDENNVYTTTISDTNGVIDYYDFNIDGITITNNGNGTLTITSANKIEGAPKTNLSSGIGARNELLPEDCKFEASVVYRWELEGTSKDFTYTLMKPVTGHKNTACNSSLSVNWGCSWKYNCGKTTSTLVCSHVGCTNCSYNYNNCGHSSCSSCDYDYDDCWHKDTLTHSTVCAVFGCSHDHDDDCKDYYCGHSTHSESCKSYYCGHTHVPACYHSHSISSCGYSYTCTKQHYKTVVETIEASYVDFQDLQGETGLPIKLTDPVYAYIAVVTDEPNEYNSETDVNIELIDTNGNVTNHIKVGERYKVRYTYTYVGASKGFDIESYSSSSNFYKFPYSSRMVNQNSTLFSIRSSYRDGSVNLTKYRLKIDPTNIQIWGGYSTVETPYASSVYTFESGNNWNDTIKLDALTTDVYDDGYTNLTATQIENSSTNTSSQQKSVTASKSNGVLTVTWVYESDYEVFTSATINARAYIEVGEDNNKTKVYYDEMFNYGEDSDHNNAGSTGYFSTDESGNLINGHIVTTPNSKYLTYALKNAVWQSDINFEISDVRLNTGNGITQPIYSKVATATHDVNYQLFYTIEVSNPTAYYDWHKLTKSNNEDTVETKSSTSEVISTTSDKYEFDTITTIGWGISGTDDYSAKMDIIDHVKTGTNYIQRVIPTTLPVLTSGNKTFVVTLDVNSNHHNYEDSYNGVTQEGEEVDTILTTTYGIDDSDNTAEISSTIYSAMNPKISKPTNIQGSKMYATTTKFNIKISDGTTPTVSDKASQSVIRKNFSFNTNNKSNRVEFPSYRVSPDFFKYSNTSYTYNDKFVNAVTGSTSNTPKTQTEKYYISEIMFKSNYTTKNGYGTNKDGWINMVTSNNKAIVAAGQGFEIKVTVKYENNNLTQYLARYLGYDDASQTTYGTSKNHTPQYCNMSPLTGRTLSGFTSLDRVASKFVTGSNVYKDLYVFMSDNPNSVYSYSGIYDTPTIFERTITYSSDFKTTTIVYTMKKSTESGVASSFSNMKFYTNQLASDSNSPGTVLQGNKSDGTHTLTIWTPVVTTTMYNYPSAFVDHYIGDAIEIGYTISTSSAEDNIGHIVQ